MKAKEIDFTFEAAQQLNSMKLPMLVRKNVYLIFKEAINNTVKHAAAGCVQVSLGLVGNCIKMSIADNGKGFDTTKPTSSSGLKNMRNRAEALNGTFHIIAAPGKGTTINITFPAT